MHRREFVRSLPIVGAAVASGATVASLTSCAGAPYLIPRLGPGGLVIAADVLPRGGEAFVQGPGMERPIYLRRDGAGAVTAVLASCTHRGCQPEPLGDRLVCPCHGSEFSFAGAVLQGPAERPLTRYEVEEEGGELVIRTGNER